MKIYGPVPSWGLGNTTKDGEMAYNAFRFGSYTLKKGHDSITYLLGE